ncbi:MAG: hypothetical protein IPK69_07395 [Phycisphaerales bacterium]|nr:MAG: hypothetical protein IPK69_07395 [Phycisphaerales bacterium]
MSQAGDRMVSAGWRGKQRISLRGVARGQRRLLLAFLAMVLMYIGAIALGAGSIPVSAELFGVVRGFLLVGLLGSGIVVIVLAAMLNIAMGRNIVMVVIGSLLMVVPLIGLLLLVSTSSHATKLLKKHGVRVGLLGPSATEVERLVDGACDSCGYDVRGLTSERCPECGGVIARGG